MSKYGNKLGHKRKYKHDFAIIEARQKSQREYTARLRKETCEQKLKGQLGVLVHGKSGQMLAPLTIARSTTILFQLTKSPM